MGKSDLILPFWGSEAFTCLSTSDYADKWYFRKAQVGNLSPACHLPFNALTIVPYSGGYPNGYGQYKSSSKGKPFAFTRKKIIKGFTHFCHSGVGYIGDFYNFFLIKLPKSEIISESASAGSYSVKTKLFSAKAALSPKCARYEISLEKKTDISIVAGFGGLDNIWQKPTFSPFTRQHNGDIYTFSVDYGNLTLYWALKTDANTVETQEGLKICPDKMVSISLSYSFSDASEAISHLNEETVEKTATEGEILWNKLLDKVEINADDDTKKLFYTCLYNSLKKPCIEDKVFDFCTLWDIYKTQLPLLFLLYPDISEKIVKGISQTFNGEKFPNCRMMHRENDTPFYHQAVCLAPIIIATAYKYGIKGDYSEYLKQAVAEITAHSSDSSLLTPRLTHNLDYIDAVYALDGIADVSPSIKKIAERRLKTVFDKDGLLLLGGKNYEYYEGCRENYSFRVSAGTFERMAHTNKKELLLALDRFFGIGGEKVSKRRIPGFRIDPYADKLKRFEGLNNEPDMDSPFFYHLLGEYEKTQKIVSEAMKRNFNTTNGGLCGNDDSGGLSSWYVWNALGLFPISGTDIILVGSPMVESAVVQLKRTLRIKTHNRSAGSNVARVTLNGSELPARQISIGNLSKGGVLDIFYL